ncbi:MAG: lipoprotein, partial [Myxococcaceae bacterium]|nr:lipoprotein [Myxococcaceae bacterium]
CNGADCSANIGITTVNGTDRQAQMSSQANFMQWYRDVSGVNRPTVFTAQLQRNIVTGTYSWDSAVAAQNGGKTFFDPFASSAAGWVGQNKESLAPCGAGAAPDRNVSFTSETHFWFEYKGGEKFDFAGDDDTWVFMNGKLAIDLGGLHSPLKGSFTLDADTDGAGADIADGSALVTSDLAANKTIPGAITGLTAGGIYEVVMFQAERNECGSNFKVTLKDFNKPKSACVSTCGDGKVASDEVCDDGVNDGAYGKCMPGCKARGPRCGDGKVDAPQETCDDGNTKNDDQCNNQCKPPKVF